MLLRYGFGAGFGACAVAAVLSVAIAAFMRDAALRQA
jgi:hypothetical protein